MHPSQHLRRRSPGPISRRKNHGHSEAEALFSSIVAQAIAPTPSSPQISVPTVAAAVSTKNNGNGNGNGNGDSGNNSSDNSGGNSSNNTPPSSPSGGNSGSSSSPSSPSAGDSSPPPQQSPSATTPPDADADPDPSSGTSAQTSVSSTLTIGNTPNGFSGSGGGLSPSSNSAATQLPGSDSPPDSSGDNGTANVSAASAGSHHGTPGGVVAVAIISTFVVFGMFIFFIRRRAIQRREARSANWIGTSGNSLLGFGAAATAASDSDHSSFNSGTRSARSSFGTNIDHGLTTATLTTASNIGTPDFSLFSLEYPPMAEVRQGGITHSGVPTGMLVSPVVTVGSHRGSISSMGSNHASAGECAYVIAPAGTNLSPDSTSSMFVSPFTPKESFAFPTPPDNTEPNGNNNDHSQQIVMPPVLPDVAISPLELEHPPAAVLAGEQLPNTPVVSAAANASSLIPTIEVTNPFEDPAGDGQVRVARRLFAPSLTDELGVSPGESVRVLSVFNDGWALAQKGGDRGLLPLECFMEVSGDDRAVRVTAAKRVSSSSMSAYDGVRAV